MGQYYSVFAKIIAVLDNLMTSFVLGGTDFDPPQLYFITILAGMANASFFISVSVDNVFEGNETFLITIEQTSLQTVTTSDNSTLVIIIDDDRKYFESLIHWFTPCIQPSQLASISHHTVLMRMMEWYSLN